MTKLEEKLNSLEKESNNEYNMDYEFVFVLKALRKALEQRDEELKQNCYTPMFSEMKNDLDTEILKVLGDQMLVVKTYISKYYGIPEFYVTDYLLFGFILICRFKRELR